MLIESLLGFRHAWRDCITSSPSAAALSGPVLTDASYPDVLVAKAFSDGRGLDLVLYPGQAKGPHGVTIERLVPGGRYSVVGAARTLEVQADARGSIQLECLLLDRTPVRLAPL